MDISQALIEIAKAIGPLLSAGFGLYGLGKPPRDTAGRLTRHGYIAAIGIVLSCIGTLIAMWAAATAESARSDQLQRSALYDAFSTKDARVNMELGVNIENIAKVDRHYATRLVTTLNSPTQCEERLFTRDGFVDRSYICQGFSIRESSLVKRFMQFDDQSPVFPKQADEPDAWLLLAGFGVELALSPRAQSEARDAQLFLASSKNKKPHYIFDGKTLKVVFYGGDVSLEGLNIASIIDLLGRRVELQTRSTSSCIELDPAHQDCRMLHAVEECDIRILHFALTFPHGRDIVFDRSAVGREDALMSFSAPEKRYGACRDWFVYTFPNDITQFPLHDRSSPLSDRWTGMP